MKRFDPKGTTLVEMCIVIVILGLLAQSLVLARLVLARKTIALQDSTFASMKALQMFNELLAQANGNQWLGTEILDSYSDGSQFNLVMTTDKSVSQPGNPLSQNCQTNGHWRYLRQVQVNPVVGTPQARQVVINVWRCASDSNPMVPGVLLTTIVGTVIPGTFSSYTQTPKVYEIPLGHY
jgi:type II secretory pathway pseudopilin PulG